MSRGAPPSQLACSEQVHRSLWMVFAVNLGTSILHPGDNMFYRTDLLPRSTAPPTLGAISIFEPFGWMSQRVLQQIYIQHETPTARDIIQAVYPQLRQLQPPNLPNTPTSVTILILILLIPPAPFRCRSRLTTFRYRRLKVQPDLQLHQERTRHCRL